MQRPRHLSPQVRHFLHTIADKFPDLFPQTRMKGPEYYGDCTLLHFRPTLAMDVEQLMDIMEDELALIILYHHIPAPHSDDGRSLCIYPLPTSPKRLIKINVQADLAGQVQRLTVMLCEDLEQLLTELSFDVRTHQREGHFKHLRPWHRVLVDFL